MKHSFCWRAHCQNNEFPESSSALEQKFIAQEVFEKRFIDETLFQFRDKWFELFRPELEAFTGGYLIENLPKKGD